jgi:hypothetical protein
MPTKNPAALPQVLLHIHSGTSTADGRPVHLRTVHSVAQQNPTQLKDLAGCVPQLREFGSGVKVVQAASHSDEQVCRQLAEMVMPQPAQQQEGSEGRRREAAWEMLGPGVTSTDVAATLAVPLAVAGEHLLTAEARGVLCRDDGPEGLRFFRNFFAEAGTVA